MKKFSAKTKKMLRLLPAAAAVVVLAALLLDAWRRQLPAKMVFIALLAWTLCVLGAVLMVMAVTESVKKYRNKNSKQ